MKETKRRSITFTLTFVYDIHPNYAKGEKFCSKCQLIHPAGYAPNKCVVCNNVLRTVPHQYGRNRKTVRVGLSVPDSPLHLISD